MRRKKMIGYKMDIYSIIICPSSRNKAHPSSAPKMDKRTHQPPKGCNNELLSLLLFVLCLDDTKWSLILFNHKRITGQTTSSREEERRE